MEIHNEMSSLGCFDNSSRISVFQMKVARHYSLPIDRVNCLFSSFGVVRDVAQCSILSCLV